MNFIRLFIFALAVAASYQAMAQESKSSCVVRAQDPVIQQFFRSKGFEVDDEKGDFRAEFIATCEANKTSIKIEIFNEYENDQRVVYHSEEDKIEVSTLVDESTVIPCADTKALKQKLLNASMERINEINCSEDDE